MNPIEALKKTEDLLQALVQKHLREGCSDYIAKARAEGTLRGILSFALTHHPDIQEIVDNHMEMACSE